jgi:hypothetical protein
MLQSGDLRPTLLCPAGMASLATQLIARAEPLRFQVARSHDELEVVYRLRHDQAVARGWIAAGDFPDGLERDEDDDQAVTITAWDGDTLAATARLVPPVHGRLLPTERAFDLRIEPRGQVVDSGRLAICSRSRLGQHRVFLGLVARVWLEMHALGFAQSCGVVSRAMERLYRVCGLQLTILGAPRVYWSEERLPALATEDAFERMAAFWDRAAPVHRDGA